MSRPARPGPESLEEAVEWLRKAFCPDAASGVAIHYRIDVTGEQGGCIGLRVDSGRLEARVGEEPGPDVVFRLSDADFFGMLAGRENPDLLFMADRLGVEGDLSLALKLRKLFSAPT